MDLISWIGLPVCTLASLYMLHVRTAEAKRLRRRCEELEGQIGDLEAGTRIEELQGEIDALEVGLDCTRDLWADSEHALSRRMAEYAEAERGWNRELSRVRKLLQTLVSEIEERELDGHLPHSLWPQIKSALSPEDAT